MFEQIKEYMSVAKFMDLSRLGSIDCGRGEIDIYNNFGKLLLLNSEPVILAKFPKNEPLKNSVIFNPRYVKSEQDVDLLAVKGLTTGRTIDIFLPNSHYYKGECFELINIKGVGAYGTEIMQVEQEKWFDQEKNKFVPFESVMDKSLGRRWGLIDTYEAKREYVNNLFEELNIPQVPHIGLNEVPGAIFPFNGTSQLVRAINTNVRFDNEILGCVKKLQEYVNEEEIMFIDKNYFEMQKRLAKENKQLISVMGRISNNRYIDGTFTDMENYAIKSFETKEEVVKKATSSFMDILGCIYLSLSLNDDKRINYLEQLEKNTGMKITKFKDKNPEIFLDRHLSQEDYKKYAGELPKMYGELKPLVEEYILS